MELNKKKILNNFLKIVDNISNKSYQRRVWIEGRGPECDDFGETVNHFFDDGEGILTKHQNFGITENQYALLKTLWDAIETFPDRHGWPGDFINTPEWTKITETAQDVLNAFHYNNP